MKILILILALTSCATKLVVPNSFEYKEISTNHFTIATWQKITNPTGAVEIYIEGDGNAFNSRGQPTRNPTPKGQSFRKLAFESSADNVVYMARPCQFVKDSKCRQEDWTIGRFSPEVIKSTGEAIKQIANNNEVVLIGFSGGAQVAGLVATTNNNIKIKQLITYAGNLDHKAWTSYHDLPELSKSMDLRDYKAQYLRIPQIHYIGSKDKVIPPFITKDFIGNDNLIKVIDGANHNYITKSLVKH